MGGPAKNDLGLYIFFKARNTFDFRAFFWPGVPDFRLSLLKKAFRVKR